MTQAVGTLAGGVDVPSKATQPKAVPVRIEGETYEEYKRYAALFGGVPSKVINQALRDALETTYRARFEALSSYVKGERALAPEDLTPTPEYTPADAMEEKVVLEGAAQN